MIIGKFLLGFQALSSDPVAYEPQRTLSICWRFLDSFLNASFKRLIPIWDIFPQDTLVRRKTCWNFISANYFQGVILLPLIFFI